jgi:predicted MPP superfamily phosphohydrolase
MSEGLLIAIIAACIVFVAALCALVYWYAFRFEPVNFKVSDIKINLAENIDAINDVTLAIGKRSDSMDNTAGVAGKHSEITGKTAVPDFTILHLSDFHLRKDRKGEKLFEFVRSLSSYSPDFIFITGDLVEKDRYFDYLVEMLEGLNAKAGKYAVFGVHDYYNKTPKEFMKNMVKRQKEYRLKNDVFGLISKLDGIGIKVLRNERVSHALSPDFSINITGLEDSIIDKTDIDKAFGKYSKEDVKEDGKEDALYKTGNCREESLNKDLFVPDRTNTHELNDNHKIEICLTHTPDMDLFDNLVENGVDIVLAGHTHGGQVRLPGIGAIIAGCNIKAKYASGLFYFKKFVLYISRGLGEGRYSPFRFYCPPEATVIRISFKNIS